MRKKIYLDYAAATPVDPRVMKVMKPYFSEKFGNTMSLHSFGQEGREVLEKSREAVAGSIKARPKEIIFTSSATESNNLALKGVAFANQEKGRHIIISPIEHPCVLESANWLAKQGFKITQLPVDKFGLVNPADVEKAVKKDTILVSVIHASNEIGTIEPIEEIGQICRKNRVYFHTDAAQSFGKIPIDVNKMNVDLLTGSSHKIYGPKGAALLFIKEGVKIEPILHGGAHEFKLRGGTVNLPAVVGFSEAIKIRQKEMNGEIKRLTHLRDKLIENILKKISGSHLNGHPKKRLPNNVNIRFDFIEGESLVLQLDGYGFMTTTGSACSSTDLKPSHILLAIGLRPQEAHGSLRMTLGKWTKEKDIDELLKVLPAAVERLRKLSPFKS
ncbi:MAG: cysteine desulfurase NifS [Candidatus Portnoybacteria bacterium RIFCSPLOWO2_01_FULL_43_11]|uniref:cysteine desulfurase n=2 Tax=Candidatus Portnoyibacteriota TaxID=1817913 RepID=A0A1G2FBD4_9BACT|nr:MAG: cysteine desulfurase NifS [Candidatus Portnoybacteria bacterium RIFCSPHIGHO2_01_FULL_40_12b]OGZ36848.1 MAG: cysteine desulfurase NifS [Candidatus Portnoybacteria bacterium RIFCSPHIGHO2_02_FULL_40_23]OGZ38244.1 MAG: cysteine desulfurase NifS [Candidatus Portnoybacteria bacterium RIFCSPLOWO2_01_FULL_43_11]